MLGDIHPDTPFAGERWLAQADAAWHWQCLRCGNRAHPRGEVCLREAVRDAGESPQEKQRQG